MAPIFSRLFGMFAGPVAEGTTDAVMKQLLETTFKSEGFKRSIETHGKMLRSGIFADLSQKDESAFERVKEQLEAEMIQKGVDPEEAAQIMHEFDRFLSDPTRVEPWQAKVFRFTVIAQESMEGRLSVLRRMFTLPGGNTDEERLVIMQNIASEEPIMMKFGEWIFNTWMAHAIPGMKKTLNFSKDQVTALGRWFYSNGESRAKQFITELWLEYEPKAQELAQDLKTTRQSARAARRARYGLK